MVAKASVFSFWRTVLIVECMDIAFSVDSILAAVALSQSYFTILTGGIIGIIAMRYAAGLFILLMEYFKRLEHTAYILVAVIGSKLILEAAGINISSSIFYLAMSLALCYGFSKRTKVSVLNLIKENV